MIFNIHKSHPLRPLDLALYGLAISIAIVDAFAGGSAGLDLKVYRDGGLAASQGLDFYRSGLDPLGNPGLPFTYPPFAALLFIPLALVPLKVGMLVTSLASTWFALMCLSDLGRRVERIWGASNASLYVPLVGLVSTPYLATIEYGQVNIILMSAIYLSLTKKSNHLSGILPWAIIGIAAGIKLTPLALLIIPLARNEFRHILTGLLSFLMTQVVGYLALPRQSLAYWTSVIWDPSRVGGVSYIDNLSAKGALSRMGISGGIPLIIAIFAVIILGIIVIRKINFCGEDRVIVHLGVGATVMLFMSPISWVHHYVWWPVMTFSWMLASRGIGEKYGRAMTRTVILLFTAAQIVSAKSIMGISGMDIQGTPPWWATLISSIATVGSFSILLIISLFVNKEKQELLGSSA